MARKQAGLDDAVRRLTEAGHDPERIAVKVADMSDVASIESWVEELPWIREDGLWGLVQNAAVELLKPAVEYDLAEIQLSLNVKVVAPLMLIKHCHPHLKARGGNIVYVGSVADFKREPRYGVYAGSKAFMKSFVGHTGQELGYEGIRINIVSPGATETELMKHMRDVEKAWPEEQIRDFLSRIPIEQRNGTPREMAEAIWFALSGPRYFHGEDLRVYGGHP